MYTLTDQTRGHTVRSHDGILIGYLHLLWLIWGHVVTLSWTGDSGPAPQPAGEPR